MRTLIGVAPSAPGSQSPGSYRFAGVDLAVQSETLTPLRARVRRFGEPQNVRAMLAAERTAFDASGTARILAARAARGAIVPGRVSR